MVKPLSFKGDDKKASKKRKRDALSEQQAQEDRDGSRSRDKYDDGSSLSGSRAVARTSNTTTEAAAAATTTITTSTTSNAAAEEEGEDDSWVSADTAADIAGPVIFVMSTSPATCVATDAYGKVFASELENMVEGDARTAEPHDVRQVWVASRVAGTDSFSFKGHHGRYLGCDRLGIVSATNEAITPAERFSIVPVPDVPGALAMQTVRDTFIGVVEPAGSGVGGGGSEGNVARMAVRGDADAIGFGTTLRIRMQARFKPRLKAVKADRAREKISRKELEAAVGRPLLEDEVRTLKRARRKGNYHEALLDVKVKGKHDKFA